MTLRRYRWYLRLPSYLAYRRWLAQQPRDVPDKQPLVLFDFSGTRIDGPQGRRVYALFIFFVRAGYYPVLQAEYVFLANIRDKLKGLILRERFSIADAGALAGRQFVLVTDRNSRWAKQADRIIRIDYRPGHTEGDGTVPMPFSLFPRLYADGTDLRLDAFRVAPRQWAVFFGGDADPAKYSKPSIRRVYGKLSRPQMLDILRTALPAHAVVEPTDQAGFDAVRDRKLDGLVIMNTRHCRVAADQWLPTLSKARFFLACPGYRYPMSHNAIEAMAIGTVPILQYPELFFPALRDGVNCLCFDSAGGLTDAVNRALAMPEAEWCRMRDAAIQYYESHLAPGPTVETLMQTEPDASNTVHLRYLPFFKPGGGFA